MSNGIRNRCFIVILVTVTLVNLGWCKGAAGGKGGARGPQEEVSSSSDPSLVDPGSTTVKNMGKLANHNWLIYGPILVCICLITLCMMYEKIYLCYLSSKHGKEEKKPIPEVPTLVIESAPETVNHSRQQLTATVQEQSTLLAARQPDSLLAARQPDNHHRALVRTDEVTSAGGLSDLDRVVMSRKLVERLQESAGQYWTNGDHVIRADDQVIRPDGIRLTDSDVYSQLKQLKSHSNTFTIESQSGTLRLRTESPGHQQPDLEVSERGLEMRSESDTSRGEKRSESGERQRLKSRQQGRLLSETGKSETGRSETGRSETGRKIRTDVKPGQKVSKSRVQPNSDFGDNLYHLLPSEDRYSG